MLGGLMLRQLPSPRKEIRLRLCCTKMVYSVVRSRLWEVCALFVQGVRNE